MRRRTGLGNRAALLIIGLILLLGGATALLRGLAVWPRWLGRAGDPVIDTSTRHWVHDQPWFWPTVAAVAVLLFLMALRWILIQGQPRLLRRVALEPDNRHGVTFLPARAIIGALENDLAGSPHVRHSRGALTGTATSPRLALSVTLGENADPAEAVTRVHQALARMRDALEDQDLDATVRIRTGRPTPDRPRL